MNDTNIYPNSVKIIEKDRIAEVYLNGEKLNGVYAYNVNHTVNEARSITLSLLADTVIERG